jgi:hypothetical protein
MVAVEVSGSDENYESESSSDRVSGISTLRLPILSILLPVVRVLRMVLVGP